MAETDDKQAREHQLARERSHQDAAATNQSVGSSSQAAILINGGAATAMLAYFAKATPDKNFLHYAPYALAGYALGVVCGAFVLFFRTLCVQRWAVAWEGRFLGYAKADIDKAKKWGRRWQKAGYACFIFSMLLFVVASAVVVYSLLEPSQPAG